MWIDFTFSVTGGEAVCKHGDDLDDSSSIVNVYFIFIQ